jgi:hypothetical protein
LAAPVLFAVCRSGLENDRVVTQEFKKSRPHTLLGGGPLESVLRIEEWLKVDLRSHRQRNREQS